MLEKAKRKAGFLLAHPPPPPPPVNLFNPEWDTKSVSGGFSRNSTPRSSMHTSRPDAGLMASASDARLMASASALDVSGYFIRGQYDRNSVSRLLNSVIFLLP